MYHEGEIAIQTRAGVAAEAQRVGRIIGNAIPPVAREFLAARDFVVAATCGRDIAASLLIGSIVATDEHTVRIEPVRGHIERVTEDLARDPRIGLLAIDFVTRRRMRVNGDARLDGGAIVVSTREVYSNCPQYLSGRGSVDPAKTETFFIATAHPRFGADASHRGGPPGFVSVDGDRISWSDFRGNNMFNTLGNLDVDPRCGLLFVDFESGESLQVSGRAVIEWKGTERRVVVAAAPRE